MQPHARYVTNVPTSAAPRNPRLNSANTCRQCGNRLFMPEWSEWRDTGHAHHLWQCDACGYAFETRIYLAAA